MFVCTAVLYEYTKSHRKEANNLFDNTHVRNIYHGIIYIANEGRRVRILNIYINNIMMFICVFKKYNSLISAFVLFQQFGV